MLLLSFSEPITVKHATVEGEIGFEHTVPRGWSTGFQRDAENIRNIRWG